jgi:uncharacterized membrane protein YhiD involved in acid resistance
MSERNREDLLYVVILVAILLCTIVAFVSETLVDCPYSIAANIAKNSIDHVGWGNPAYAYNACRLVRHSKLLGLNMQECKMARRMIISCILGAMIGYERRRADRPAGIRTMALASLGSCTFTICSIYAFVDSSMEWDASRVSAAIPSGVGFLGAGLIWKGSDAKQVGGLVTAASVWLSAAVGVGCGGGLFFVAIFTTLNTMVVLKYGANLVTLGSSADEPLVGNAAEEAGGDKDERGDQVGSLNTSNYGSMGDRLDRPLLPPHSSKAGRRSGGLMNRPMGALARLGTDTKESDQFFLSKDT